MGAVCSTPPAVQFGADACEEVRKDLLRIMDSPEWDDGSYAPLLIRLAWHSSGTYCKEDGTGGSNGATMRYTLEAGDPENAGLDHARAFLEPVKQKHPWLSFADLWIFAAYVAIEHTGGPRIDFTGGRVDAPEKSAVAPGRLPGAERGIADGWKLDADGRMEGWENLAKHIREVFGRMGLGDKEAVALICGGHVYGRCHPESSGYNGAWVENPTMFSNEYAADMVGDKWIAVTHDTKMPDGGPVPEEVRPAQGKRQYIDLSKYEGEEGERKAIQAPDATAYPPGRYKCVSSWVNIRELPDTSSPIVGRFVQEKELSLVSVKVFGTAVRGLAERGGWVSIIASGGKTLFERQGDLDLWALCGRYRAVAASGALVYPSLGAVAGDSRVKAGHAFCVGEVARGQDGDQAGALLGKRADPGPGNGEWVVLFSPSSGLVSELIVEGYNEKPRKAIKGQLGHQMMLVSDMVLLWDEAFKKHIEVYAEDEDLLKKDFGDAFRRLTELGCPWSADGPGNGCAGGASQAAGGIGCPHLRAVAAN
uniref:Plant heme peroxidase family profile domain-containing protein n=1 Tax=Alexandrium andersonii TaxID=327968 RepID=A0A7S2DJQ0_9DINO|mmetsp:Transcript_5502/g.12466  ORF Transcript_5502/g.12466 Transcript_5502/m.12466 type:complete len:535 (+) Transcript_5502:24-1628(+)